MKSSELDEGYKEMYLINPDDMGRISQTDPDAVYVLNEKPKEIMKNICYFTWQEPETYVSILNALFPEEPYMYELAKRYWQQGYQLDSNFFPLCYLKARILQQNNKYYEAVALFNRVIEFIQGDGEYSFSNVSEVMFLYHSMERIADIAEFYYNNKHMQDHMTVQMELLKKTLNDYFEFLNTCMACISTDSFTKDFFHKGLEMIQKKLM